MRVHASYVYLVGGTWACRRAKTPRILWLFRSPSMISRINIHDGALLLPGTDSSDLTNYLTSSEEQLTWTGCVIWRES